jgi:hypothetical protein
MWIVNENKQREFLGGKDSWSEVIKEAEKCSFFKFDVDEEVIEEEVIACYNCTFRRWTDKSFTCCYSTKME